ARGGVGERDQRAHGAAGGRPVAALGVEIGERGEGGAVQRILGDDQLEPRDGGAQIAGLAAQLGDLDARGDHGVDVAGRDELEQGAAGGDRARVVADLLGEAGGRGGGRPAGRGAGRGGGGRG